MSRCLTEQECRLIGGKGYPVDNRLCTFAIAKEFGCAADTGYSFTDNQIVYYDSVVNAHPYVNLDLPSGTRWATMNIGASSVTGYGYYFKWGNATAYTNGSNPGNSSSSTWTDMATYYWGDRWTVPTPDQYKELVNYCTLSWTTVSGVVGVAFSRNGQTLFLPAAGAIRPNTSSVIYASQLCIMHQSGQISGGGSGYCFYRNSSGDFYASVPHQKNEAYPVRAVSQKVNINP